MIRVIPPRERLHAFATPQRRADDRCLFCSRTARECVEQADPSDRLAPERCDGQAPYPAINSFYLL